MPALAPQMPSAAASLRREARDRAGEGGRADEAGPGALHYARHKELGEAARERARGPSDGEQREADERHPPSPEPVGELSARDHQ